MNKRFDKNGIMVDNMTSDELEIKRGDKLGVQGIHSGWELKYSPYIAIEFSGFDNLPITLPMMDLIIDEEHRRMRVKGKGGIGIEYISGYDNKSINLKGARIK